MSKGASSLDGGIQVSPSQAETKAKQLDLNYAMDEVNLNIMISSFDRKNNKKSNVGSDNDKNEL